MSNRPLTSVGFPPLVLPRRACLADVLVGLMKLSSSANAEPAKGSPRPKAKHHLVTLRPTRKRVVALWLRLAITGLAGAGLVLLWQLADPHSLTRASLRSLRQHLYRQIAGHREISPTMPPLIRKQLREVRR